MKHKCHCPQKEAKLYSSTKSSRAEVEFFNFDKAYVDRLRDGDPSTEQHFVAYFEQLLRIKLRYRRLTSDIVEDLRQETFIRVIANLRKDGGVRQPERFVEFVTSIGNNALRDHYRLLAKNTKNQTLEKVHMELPDNVLDFDGILVTNQSTHH